MYELLLQKFQQGHFGEVISLAQSNNINPNNDPNCSHILAASYFSLGQLPESIDILSELESSLANDSNYLGLYGAALRRSGDLVASEKYFLRALESDPNSLILQNNYANLLIDSKRYDEAYTILSKIVSIDSSYIDAAENLNRLMSLRSLSDPVDASSKDNRTDSIKCNTSKSLDTLLDPLLMAFASDEVKSFGRLEPLSGLKKVTDNPDVRSIGLEKLQLANKAVAEGNSDYALKLCSQSYVQLGCESVIYDCASDAYLRANRFLESELSILHALAMSGPSIKLFINLISLSSMRRDFKLAEFYFDKALCLDSTNPVLPSIRQQLDKLKVDESHNSFLFENPPPSSKLTLQSS